MSEVEKVLGRIKAIIEVADQTVEKAKVHGDKISVAMAKEVAYDHIRRIVEEEGESNV